MSTVKMKGSPARNFFAIALVDEHGEDALNQCAYDSPMYWAVYTELEFRKQEAEKQSEIHNPR